jgi:FtsP/CotA-like multicopper oxidase with cupredoxin domain
MSNHVKPTSGSPNTRVTRCLSIGLLGFLAAGCSAVNDAGENENVARVKEGVTTALAPELPATSIPRFQTQLQRFYDYVPNLTRDYQGRITRKEYTVQIAKFQAQQLPPGFPPTPLFGYGGNVRVKTGPNGQDVPSLDGTGTVKFKRTSPGPKFEQTRFVPALIHYRNELLGEHFLPVDPTLDWANPNNFPKPSPPFLPFPPGYAQAQSPIVHTTHTHGIEVVPEFDGTPDTWFTNNNIRGPEYVSNDYVQPSSNESAAFWYHDHSFGVTRLDVGMGLSGYSMLRDPNNPLDRVGNADIFGFEDPNDFSSTTVALESASNHTEGSRSVSAKAKGFNVLKSRTFELTNKLGSSVSLDLFLPQEQPNPSWFGAVQLYVDCPSKAVNNAFLSQVELTGKTRNAFNQLSFSVPTAIADQVGACADFSFSVALNVPINATGTYLLDNVQGVTKSPNSPLPAGEFEVPLIVQDRTFRTDGTVFYPTAQTVPPGTIGANPDVNPYWVLMFDGTTNVVNGTVWPNMDVKRHLYRLRILNSANQRFYTLSFSNGMSFRVIGSDGGYLEQAHTVTSVQVGVTERVDLLVDFSQVPVGTKIVMQNTARLQPPIGNPPDPNTDGTVMQFTVVNSPSVPPKAIPAQLNTIADLTPDRPTRTLIQNVEQDDEDRILQAELDGQLFHELTTELPTVGSTEDWQFVNLTPLTHNKHVHLIQFQVVSRQNIDVEGYLADWLAANGNPPFDHPTLKQPVDGYLMGAPEGPEPEESGWKDTVRTPAGQVTKIRIRWAQQTGAASPGVNNFPFNPSYGIGFVWHCHLVEHEDNEMMRPMTVIPTWRAGVSYPVGFRNSPGVARGLVDFNGVDFEARVPHASVAGQTPPTRPDLWARINNQNGDWAVQIIYDIGDRVFFGGHVYRALSKHQATAATQPNLAPAVWALVL